MARFCRAVKLSHMSPGSFRRRFFPDEPTDCAVCRVLQDRAHVLLKCPKYRRWWTCQGESGFRLQRVSAYRGNTANESAFTFADAPDCPTGLAMRTRFGSARYCIHDISLAT